MAGMRGQDRELIYEEVNRRTSNGREGIFVYKVSAEGVKANGDPTIWNRGYRARTRPYSEQLEEQPGNQHGLIEVVVNGPGLSKATKKLSAVSTRIRVYETMNKKSRRTHHQKRVARKALIQSQNASKRQSGYSSRPSWW